MMTTVFEIINTDITELDCDAIVNAANTSLLGGGGVDGIIHQKAGSNLVLECEKLGGCPTGQARITPGFDLKARYVIHAVGPIWKDGKNGEMDLLRDAYSNAIKLALENEIESIAFPNISTGIYRFPKRQAARIAVETVKKEMKNSVLRKVIFACFDKENFRIYKELTAT